MIDIADVCMFARQKFRDGSYAGRADRVRDICIDIANRHDLWIKSEQGPMWDRFPTWLRYVVEGISKEPEAGKIESLTRGELVR